MAPRIGNVRYSTRQFGNTNGPPPLAADRMSESSIARLASQCGTAHGVSAFGRVTNIPAWALHTHKWEREHSLPQSQAVRRKSGSETMEPVAM